MKKILIGLIAFALVGGGALSATLGKSTLYKYESVNGTLQYSTNPVPMTVYANPTQPVEIPDEYVANKFEFRGAWVATVFNLHMPKTNSEADFKTAYTKILDNYVNMNMNTVLFQIRPELDAFYPSQINPWSRYMSSNQGVDPGWDPLAYMIDATHARGLEYHAWFNPFRVNATPYNSAATLTKLGKTLDEVKLMSSADIVRLMHEKGMLADNNFAVLHPEYTLQYEFKIILDPGIPEVRQHIVDTIDEVLQNYDVDAIHFDDYFYPYKAGLKFFGELNEDRKTFTTYGLTAGYADTVEGIEAWRRDNVTSLVRELHNHIDQHNAQNNTLVQFGISPFGIWDHIDRNPLGSTTSSADASSSFQKQIFADSRLWVKEELVDYIVPQVYWAFNTSIAPYGELVRWWSDVVEGTDVSLYIGHANYKYATTNTDWKNPEEVPNQLRFNQDYNVEGSAFYSFNETVYVEGSTTPKDLSLVMIKSYYNQFKSLPPAKRSLDAVKPEYPNAPQIQADGKLTWQGSSSSDEMKYIVYRQDRASFTTLDDMISSTKNVLEVMDTNSTKMFEYTPATTFVAEEYVYAVTTVDQAYNESLPIQFTELIVAPTHTDTVVESTLTITGTATPNYEIVIELVSGQTVTVTVTPEGTYEAVFGLTTDTDTVKMYVKNPLTGDMSEVISYSVEKQIPPIEVVAKPTETHTVTGDTLTIKGTATPNFEVVITLESGQTKTVTVAADGTYTASFELTKDQDVVSMYVKNPTTQVVSEPVVFSVAKAKVVEVVAKPTHTHEIVGNTLTIKGTATPNYEVVITLLSGQTKTVTVAADGTYTASFEMTTDQDVVAMYAKNPTTSIVSETIVFKVEKVIPTEVVAKPTVSYSIKDNMLTIKGTATPNYEVVVTLASGQTKTVVANAQGAYEVSFNFTLEKDTVVIYAKNPTTSVMSDPVSLAVLKDTTVVTEDKKVLPKTGYVSTTAYAGAMIVFAGASLVFKRRKK